MGYSAGRLALRGGEGAWRGKTVRTAIWKTPVQGGRMVRQLNIDGDGQGDLAGHGGEQGLRPAEFLRSASLLRSSPLISAVCS
jgi:hypothetical protein